MNNRRLSDIREFSQTLTLLIIEDDELVLNQLKKSFSTLFTNILISNNGFEALDIYYKYHKKHNKFIDIVFTDLNLPIMNGLEFCEKIKLDNEKQIIIATSAYADINNLQKIIDLGIYKFIPKPLNFENLFEIIIKSLEKIKEEQKIIKLHEELTSIKNENIRLFEQASLDKLTGLYNRRYIDDILSKYINCNFSLIFTDIDYFKDINDTYGHRVGDEVLIEFAKILKNHTRSYDIVGRWGGEEFIILLKETDVETTLFITEKLRKTIESHEMPENIKITSSFGIHISNLNKSLEEIIDDADENLYYAKKQGKNRISYNFEIYKEEN